MDIGRVSATAGLGVVNLGITGNRVLRNAAMAAAIDLSVFMH